MPKEAVVGCLTPYGEGDPRVSLVEVLWARGQHVQVVSRCARAVDHGKPENTETEDYTFSDGFYVDLDRKGINDLIRNLRKARDQAFGRDE